MIEPLMRISIAAIIVVTLRTVIPDGRLFMKLVLFFVVLDGDRTTLLKITMPK